MGYEFAISLFTDALEGRYGKATGVEDFVRRRRRSHEGQRAMFEAFAQYTRRRVIQWMLNNAWPSMIWPLDDYYLRPGGGYFGSKLACEPLHVQYSYDDRSIAVVNDRLEPRRGLTVSAKVYDLSLAEKFSREAAVDVGPDAVVRAFVLPAPAADWGRTYFVRLALRDAEGREMSRNFYWLSTQEDQIDWANTKWYYTPTKSHADLRALASLPKTTLAIAATMSSAAGEPNARVTVKNTGSTLAFQVRLKAIDPRQETRSFPFPGGQHFALFPGEAREITVSFSAPAAGRPPSSPRPECRRRALNPLDHALRCRLRRDSGGR
jgi:exo-1,4-beta-D-glucosaminidase